MTVAWCMAWLHASTKIHFCYSEQAEESDTAVLEDTMDLSTEPDLNAALETKDQQSIEEVMFSIIFFLVGPKEWLMAALAFCSGNLGH